MTAPHVCRRGAMTILIGTVCLSVVMQDGSRGVRPGVSAGGSAGRQCTR